VDDGGKARILKLAGEFNRRELCCFPPALDYDPVAPGIDTDHDAFRIGGSCGFFEKRIFYRPRSAYYAAFTRAPPHMHLLHTTDGAAHLHLASGLADNLLDDVRVFALVENRVDIDHMQPLGAFSDEVLGAFDGIQIVHDGIFHLAIQQIYEASLAE